MNTLTPKEITDNAAMLATRWHNGQEYGNGQPYYRHLFRVYFKVCKMSPDHNIQAAALLHDVLEDTECDPDSIETMCGKEVLGIVITLTHSKDVHYMDYINLVKMDWRATKVKIADLLDNLSHCVDYQSSYSDHANRYAEALAILTRP